MASRRYRKPIVTFEHGTRIYAPSEGEPRYRLIAKDADGARVFQKFRTEEEAVFHLFFRRNPFGGGFAVACGLARALDYLAGFLFTAEDVAYLAGLLGNDGRPLFDPSFLG